MLLQWLTFISATIAAVFAGRKAVQGWLYARLDRIEARRAERGTWSRYGVDTWAVRLAEPGDEAVLDAAGQSAVLSITLVDHRGQPAAQQADRLRRYLEDHQHISRNMTPAELDTLEQVALGRLAVPRPRRLRLPEWRGAPGRRSAGG
jgi:hypothetical protein